MKTQPLTQKSFVSYALAGLASGICAPLTLLGLVQITSYSSGFRGLGGFSDALVTAALLMLAVMPIAIIYIFIVLKLRKEKPALPIALLGGAGVYTIFVLLRAASIDTGLMVFLCGGISAVWTVGAGVAMTIARPRWAAYLIVLAGIVLSYITAPMLAVPISDAAGKRIDQIQAGNLRHSLDFFTIYAAPNLTTGPRLAGDSYAAVEFSVKSSFIIRESEVIDGDDATIAPPYKCALRALTGVMTGRESLTALMKAADDTPVCHKIGLTADNKPVYQQQSSSTDENIFYYYTRKGNTHIVVSVPLGIVVDASRNVNQEVIDIINSLQPFEASKVADPL